MTEQRFIDAHVHIRSLDGLAEIKAAGIVAARDAGLRQRSDGGGPRFEGMLPLVKSALWALYKKGGYGSLFGVAVEDRSGIKAEILRLKRAGAAIIKVMASGIVSLKEAGRITPGGFTADELACLVQEAGEAGLSVMAHANGEGAIIAAASAGVRSIEHGFFMTTHALEAIARSGSFWVPTVDALDRAARDARQEVRSYVRSLIGSHLEMIGRAASIGVPLAVGTDCTVPDPRYREAYEAELGWFEQAGLSRDAVLTFATEGGAKLLDL